VIEDWRRSSSNLEKAIGELEIMNKIAGALRAARSAAIVAIGVSLAMAQQPAGTLRTWGNNDNGQLGDGLAGNSPIPQSVPTLTDVVTVAVGERHTVAIKSDGSVWAWGNNAFGQVGNPSAPLATTLPAPVIGLGAGSGVIAVAAGSDFSLALKADGTVLAWGRSTNGQLGNGGALSNPPFNSVPTQVVGLGSGSGVIAVGAGLAHSIALKSDGTVLTWGFNGSGQLGLGGGVNQSDRSSPVVASGLGSGSGVIAIAAGGNHNLALKSDGSVDAWGNNTDGEVGIGTLLQTRILAPTAVSGLGSGAGIIAIAAGFTHSMALKSDGSVLAWGNNKEGELGNGDATGADQSQPVAVSGFGNGSGVIAIAGGNQHSMALKSDGTELTWGINTRGQLGNGGATGLQAETAFTPVQVSNLNGAVAIAQGSEADHSLAIVQPVAALSSASLSFGDQLVGTLSASQMITIQNNGQDPLVINSLSLSGASADFKISAPPTPFTIAQGTSASISVAFDPTAAFARLATLLIDGNSFNAPQIVALSGNGLAQADIAAAIGADSNRVKNGGNLTYTISVRNIGPTLAPDVVMTDSLPSDMTFVSSKASQGTCSTPAPGTTGAVTCNLGTINTGATTTITLVVSVHSPGVASVVNTISAVAQAPDANLSNNSATIATSVFGPKK
jgi:uncharacterized repeat protein (TIGR01451 family)